MGEVSIACYPTVRGGINRIKLDGVGPVDNRPSPDELHHFVKNKTKNLKRDM